MKKKDDFIKMEETFNIFLMFSGYYGYEVTCAIYIGVYLV